ncbi:hypothetical protein L596_015457 [Steinernema carpocapsae]|uniref:Uncharacterized protein n=1 Tax=Steinernema carpocapsae TaxID=34508 RepID=A0A4U5NFN1_STECR|nr:hypothetical protein L596_015457 [Steinernema carpocapsae]
MEPFRTPHFDHDAPDFTFCYHQIHSKTASLFLAFLTVVFNAVSFLGLLFGRPEIVSFSAVLDLSLSACGCLCACLVFYAIGSRRHLFLIPLLVYQIFSILYNTALAIVFSASCSTRKTELLDFLGFRQLVFDSTVRLFDQSASEAVGSNSICAAFLFGFIVIQVVIVLYTDAVLRCFFYLKALNRFLCKAERAPRSV